MQGETSGQSGSATPAEAQQQCLVRSANEATELSNMAPPGDRARTMIRCECGDPGCSARLHVTHTEYEAVRAYGSRFVIKPDHENPENTSVIRENARFAVVDVVAGDVRYQVMADNPRHAWVDARDWSLE